MIVPPNAIPIDLKLLYEAAGDPFDQEEGKLFALDSDGAIPRVGSIDIERKTDGKERFEIQLNGDGFLDPGPRRWLPVGTINLDSEGVFQIVQECREAWQQAVTSFKLQDQSDPQHREHSVYELARNNPLDDQSFRTVVSQLAVAGVRMFESLFEANRRTLLDDVARRLRRVVRSGECALTINASDFHVPWRMLYTHPDTSQELAPDGSNFDPRGFWGYQHIVEQFTNKHKIKDHVLAKGKLGFAAALHETIDKESM